MITQISLAAFAIASFALSASSSTPSTLPAPGPIGDPCIGCQLGSGVENSGMQVVGNCTIAAALQVSGFSEDCGETDSCNLAKCEYDFKFVYRTSGVCDTLAFYFGVGSTVPAVGPFGASATDYELDAGTWGPKFCGLGGSWEYNLYSDSAGTNLLLGLFGDHGCNACE